LLRAAKTWMRGTSPDMTGSDIKRKLQTQLRKGLDGFLPDGQIAPHTHVILRCEPCGALAPLGEPRRIGHGLSSFEAREELAPQDDDLNIATSLAMTETKKSAGGIDQRENNFVSACYALRQ
jgi:hypothetical protein